MHDFKENTLAILRFCAEGKDDVMALLKGAVEEAGRWGFGKVVMWDPSEAVERAVKGVEGVSVGEREGSLSSLRVLGEGMEGVEW
ncbi:hypothetical protein HK097_005599, partial [Rhizophlyctis rosea]